MKKRPKKSLGIVMTHATQFDGPLFRFLAKQDWFDLTVYYTQVGGDQQARDYELGRKTSWDNDIRSGYNLCVRKPGVLGFLRMLIDIVSSRHDLLIVSGYLPMSHLVITLLAKLAGINIGLRSDSILPNEPARSIKKNVKRYVLPILFKMYKTGHPTGTLARDYLIHYGMNKEKLFLFPYNVDIDWLVERAKSALDTSLYLRVKYGISPDAFVVLSVIKFVPREDPITLLQAFELFHKMFPKSHLVLVGDGQLRATIENYVESVGLKGYVHMPGFVSYSELPSHYVMADVFVHPAIKEQWGVSVNEAMVCGIPVIVADTVGAAKDLIKDRITGFIFPAKNPSKLANLLFELAKSESLRKHVIAMAKREVAKWNYLQTALELKSALEYLEEQRSR